MKQPPANWILMPTLNCYALTRDAIATCFAQDIPVKLLCIDATSDDGLAEYLRSLHPKIQLISLPRRAGVSKAWNIGLEYLFDVEQAGHALVINSDVLLRKDAYRLLLADGGSFITCVGTSSGALWPGGMPTNEKRPHPDFSCYLIRRECWQRVGRFDESMKIFASDGDYHLRMHQAGIWAGCIDLPFWHYASGTLKQADPEERGRILEQANLDRDAFAEKWGVRMGSPEYYDMFKEKA